MASPTLTFLPFEIRQFILRYCFRGHIVHAVLYNAHFFFNPDFIRNKNIPEDHFSCRLRMATPNILLASKTMYHEGYDMFFDEALLSLETEKPEHYNLPSGFPWGPMWTRYLLECLVSRKYRDSLRSVFIQNCYHHDFSGIITAMPKVEVVTLPDFLLYSITGTFPAQSLKGLSDDKIMQLIRDNYFSEIGFVVAAENPTKSILGQLYTSWGGEDIGEICENEFLDINYSTGTIINRELKNQRLAGEYIGWIDCLVPNRVEQVIDLTQDDEEQPDIADDEVEAGILQRICPCM